MEKIVDLEQKVATDLRADVDLDQIIGTDKFEHLGLFHEHRDRESERKIKEQKFHIYLVLAWF
jgi:hypothetical protein